MAGRCGHKLLLGLGGISPTEFMTKFRWSNEAGRVDYAHPKTSTLAAQRNLTKSR